MKINDPNKKELEGFLKGKSEHTLMLFDHFVKSFKKIGDVQFIPAKTMIGVATPRKRVAWVTQLGRNFVHVVFPFKEAYTDNLCFQKIAQVPGDATQFNHHFLMYNPEDINSEIKKFMKMALDSGK